MGRSKHGKELIDRLSNFSLELEKGEKISVRHRATRVVLNLKPQDYGPDTVRQTREILKLSQALFAQFIGVTVSTVQKWESGVNEPTATAARLMDEIRANPEYWKGRLKDSMEVVRS